MATEEEELYGDDLAMLLEEGASRETAGRIAKEIGFNDNPILGAKRKKTQIETEVAMINAAVIIYAVNQVVDETKAKPIIDEFLKQSNMYVFERLAERDRRFLKKYPERLAEYFEILSRDKPVLGLSFSFLRHMGGDPLKNLEGQLLFSAHLSAMLKEAMAIVEKVNASTTDYPLASELLDDEPNDDELHPELQYYEAIEKHIETVGHKETVLTVQGTDRKFCEASFKLYKAGYEHDADFKFIACATAQAAHDYEKDPELAILFLESFRDGVIDK